MGKKPIVSVTYENERISIKNSLPYLKCLLRLSCVVHGPIYGRFMFFYVNGFLAVNRYTQQRRCSYFELRLPVCTPSHPQRFSLQIERRSVT